MAWGIRYMTLYEAMKQSCIALYRSCMCCRGNHDKHLATASVSAATGPQFSVSVKHESYEQGWLMQLSLNE